MAKRKRIFSKIIDKTLSSGSWVGGSEIEKLEINLSKICEQNTLLL